MKEKNIELYVGGMTPANVDIRINGITPKHIINARWTITATDTFGRLVINCVNNSYYEIVDNGIVEINHGGWKIISDTNTPRDTKIYYDNKKITGIKRVIWRSDINSDLNKLRIYI